MTPAPLPYREELRMGEYTQSAWADQRIAAAYHQVEAIAETVDGTARGLLLEALSKMDLADEYVAKRIAEDQ